MPPAGLAVLTSSPPGAAEQFHYIFRALVFFGLESAFIMSDTKRGGPKREEFFRAAQK